MSNINFSTIDTTYPVAGQDNNSQGFRDNFSAISQALATAKTEIGALQTRTVLVADLSTGTDTVTNNLQGSSLVNGTTNRLYAIASNNDNVVETADIDLSNGILQICTLTGHTNFTFVNWPDNLPELLYGSIRIHLLGDSEGEWIPTFETENGGNVVFETNFPDPFTVSTTGKHQVIEAWTYNATTVFVRYIGEF